MTTARRYDLIILLLFATIAVFFSWPLYSHLDYWGIQDWDAFLFRSSVSRDALVKFGQLPLWNPYSLGGVPHLAHPETNVFSISFFIELLFGVLIGARVSIILYLFLGLVGMYGLARHFNLGRQASFLTASLFMLNSMYVVFLTTGATSLGLSIALIPWALLFFYKSHEDLAWSMPGAIIFTLMWFQGGSYNFLLCLLFLVIIALVDTIKNPRSAQQTLTIFGAIFSGAFLLSAIRLFPSLEFTMRYPRHLMIYSGFSLESLFYGLLGRNQTIAAIVGKSQAEGFRQGYSHNMDEVGMYIGVLPFILLLVGILTNSRKNLALTASLLVFLWLGFGNRAEPLSLWELLNRIPPYSLLRTAERFRFVIMICVSLFAGFGFQWGLEMLTGKTQNPALPNRLGLLVILIILSDLFTVNSPILKDAFSIPPLKTPYSQSFQQIGGFPEYGVNGIETSPRENVVLYRSLGALYPAYLSNSGSLYALESIPAPTQAVILTDPAYKGEVYLDGTGGSAAYELWTPNRLRVRLAARGDGYLVINQNYYPGWRVKGGLRAESHNGLLAVQVTPQTSEVELYYLPTSFVIGAFTSLAGLLLMTFLLLKRRRRSN